MDELDKENVSASIASISEYLNIEPSYAESLLNDKRHSNPNSDDKKSLSETLEEIGIPKNLIEKNQIKFLHPEKHIQRDQVMVNLLKQVKIKAKSALLTNTREVIATRILKCIGLKNDDFDLILTGDKLEEAKPSQKEILNCLKVRRLAR